jgi:hypothetical protein
MIKMKTNTVDVMRKVNALLGEAWVLVYQHATELEVETDFEHPLAKLRDEINASQCKTYDICSEIEKDDDGIPVDCDDIELEFNDYMIQEIGLQANEVNEDDDIELEIGDVIVEKDGTVKINE